MLDDVEWWTPIHDGALTTLLISRYPCPPLVLQHMRTQTQQARSKLFWLWISMIQWKSCQAGSKRGRINSSILAKVSPSQDARKTRPSGTESQKDLLDQPLPCDVDCSVKYWDCFRCTKPQRICFVDCPSQILTFLGFSFSQ